MTFCGRGFGADEHGSHRSRRVPLPARVSVYDAQERRYRGPVRLGELADIEWRRGAAG